MTEANIDDSVSIRIPAKFIAGIVAISLSLGGGIATYIGPTINAEIIKELRTEMRAIKIDNQTAVTKADESLKASLRAEALGKAALDIGTQNAKATNNNRDLIVERTFDRFTKQHHLDYVRGQEGRDEQQDRRITGLERDIDRGSNE